MKRLLGSRIGDFGVSLTISLTETFQVSQSQHISSLSRDWIKANSVQCAMHGSDYDILDLND
jgi:hypothetical protein